MSSLYENDTDSIYEADSRHSFYSEQDVVNETSTASIGEIRVDGPKEYPPIVTLVYHVSIMLFAPILVICLQLLTASDCTSSTKPQQNTSSSLHYNRRIQHALTGLAFCLLSYVIPSFLAKPLLATATTLFYLLHCARSKSVTVQDNYLKLFGKLLRDHEKKPSQISGAFWFMLGSAIVVCLFPIEIARTSITCLAFGDPLAAIIGIKCGGPKVAFCSGSKTIAGCLACFWSCYIVAAILTPDLGPKGFFVTGIAATIMESLSALSCIKIDDNVLIPAGTALALQWYSDGFL
ncbi:hypothetical protein CTEN210_03766 [Chaetoceros tenuissimus]|uniref:Dolichol kinase n=1 Tax=Chaetoceros tenuissimus TaxID=426638 RepID=A0AAD3CJZ3_9STRA|nr:hypothetical protein CTEN210_03766 [Chaetoceros tenuissimus]